MNNYPKFLTYGDWFEKYFIKLPKNLILKIVYLPFYSVAALFVFFTDGFGVIVFYIVLWPLYLVYLISYRLKKNSVSNRLINLVIDDKTNETCKLKDISQPKKMKFLFIGWELENNNKVSEIWKLSHGATLFAKWEPLVLDNKDSQLSLTSSGFYTKLSGVTIGHRQSNIGKININDELIYIREPNNPYDKHAILITTKDGLEIGYIPKGSNVPLAEDMDKGNKFLIRVATITGENTQYKGVNVHITNHGSNLINNVSIKHATPKGQPLHFNESMDYSLYDSFDTDDNMTLGSSFIDRDDDSGFEPERDVDFDAFDSDY